MPFYGESLQEIKQVDFSGGVNAVTNPYIISDKQVVRARNLLLDEHGSLRTRDGCTLITQDTIEDKEVVWRGVLNKVDGSSYPYVILLQKDFITGVPVNLIVMSTLNESSWTFVGGLASTGQPGQVHEIPQAVTMLDQEIIAPGYTTPSAWNGTALLPNFLTAQADQTVPPGAKHIAFHLGSLWVYNTSPESTTLDGPSSLRMSDPNNPNSWPNLNQTFISKDDGQVGMGLASFTIAETGISPTQTLIAFKNYSAYQITGVLTLDLSGIPLFSIQKIKSDMGCIAPRSIQFVSGYGIIRLTHKGFALFTGVDDKLISEEVRPFIFGNDEIPPLNFNAVIRSFASQSQNPPLYVAACPVSGTSLTRLFVYDLARRGWTICDLPINIQCLNLIVTPTTQPVVQAGTATGRSSVYALFNGAKTDDGAPIAWAFRTKTYSVGSYMRMSYWRRAVLDVSFLPEQQINVEVTMNGIPQVRDTELSYNNPATGAIWGSSIWGQFRWAGSGMVDGRRSVDIMRTAPSAFLDVSGEGFVKIRGLALQARSKPLNRQVI